MIWHFPIVKTDQTDKITEFSHISEDTKREHWRKEHLICLDNIKINVFMEGAFSVFVDGKAYTPTFGDICVLTPHKIHSGHIPASTKTNYFQLDIGTAAFYGIPGGDALIGRLISVVQGHNAFVKPSEKNIKNYIKLCDSIEAAIENNDPATAFIRCVELVSIICELYKADANVPTGHISLTTHRAIKYIEENYSTEITLASLSAELSVSASYLSRIFKAEVGMGVHAYLTEYRVIKAASLLKSHSVADTCYMCGFADSSHFISVFKKHYSCTPKQYLKK